MIFKTKWIEMPDTNHPEIEKKFKPEKVLSVKFIDNNSIEAISEKAHRMRSLKFFDEPYEPSDI